MPAGKGEVLSFASPSSRRRGVYRRSVFVLRVEQSDDEK
jgi:hypothetical protein